MRNADKIIVLDRGRLAEMGSHDELLARGGIYERLYAINYGLVAESETAAALDSLEGGVRPGRRDGGLLPAPADD